MKVQPPRPIAATIAGAASVAILVIVSLGGILTLLAALLSPLLR